MTRYLLDANVLIALVVTDHEHHAAARDWFVAHRHVLLCSVVEGALVRTLLWLGERGDLAAEVLKRVHTNPRIEYIGESLSYTEVDLSGITGHRQVTDAYLAALAESVGARLVTFDVALAERQPGSAVLLECPA